LSPSQGESDFDIRRYYRSGLVHARTADLTRHARKSERSERADEHDDDHQLDRREPSASPNRIY
jgi:hypothetical protein